MKPTIEIESLSDLLELMKADDPRLGDWTDLPSFGGEQPDCYEAWAWDDDQMIVGSCSADIEIVDRDYYGV